MSVYKMKCVFVKMRERVCCDQQNKIHLPKLKFALYFIGIQLYCNNRLRRHATECVILTCEIYKNREKLLLIVTHKWSFSLLSYHALCVHTIFRILFNWHTSFSSICVQAQSYILQKSYYYQIIFIKRIGYLTYCVITSH